MVSPPQCTDFGGQTTNGWGDLTSYKPDSVSGYWLPNDCGSSMGAVIYFITFIIVGNYAVLNLFVAVILDNYAYMANVGDAEINLFVLEKFKKTWYRYTLKDKHSEQNLGRYLRIFKLRDFMTDLGAPLGIVVWDKEGTKKYKHIQEEVRRKAVPGKGISYRHMQYILCSSSMDADVKCELPLEEKEARQDEKDKLELERAATVIQTLYKGKKARAALGVTTGAAKSEAEQKAGDFKKKFANLMNNPNKMKLTSPAAAPVSVAQAQPAAQNANQVSIPNGVGAGVSPIQDAPPPSTSQPSKDAAEATDEVRNVFKERAAARAAARAKKGSSPQ